MTDERPIAKFLRLQQGDDIIAETVETEDDNGIQYTVYHPLKVIYSPSETDGYLSVMFMPWVFPRICDTQEFILHSRDVLLVVDVSEQMNTYYWDGVDSYVKKTKSIEETSSNYEVNEETGLTEEEENELYSKIMEQIGNKRTLH